VKLPYKLNAHIVVLLVIVGTDISTYLQIYFHVQTRRGLSVRRQVAAVQFIKLYFYVLYIRVAQDLAR